MYMLPLKCYSVQESASCKHRQMVIFSNHSRDGLHFIDCSL